MREQSGRHGEFRDLFVEEVVLGLRTEGCVWLSGQWA